MKKTNTKAPAYLLFILSLGYIMAVLDTTRSGSCSTSY
ncbi:Uncharacterised protein [Streptococcus salivarius]|nr:Uncharacterised protein [Streptococcus salivarius]VUW81714.1 Uncharacterised protein [Streptococcus thermophilus]